MKRTNYDLKKAQSLLPFLRSVAGEFGERSDRVTEIESGLLALGGTADAPDRTEESRRLEAELAAQRRELRQLRRELGRLGCAIDDDRPLRILIPGEDGNFESGFAWDGLKDQLERATVGVA